MKRLVMLVGTAVVLAGCGRASDSVTASGGGPTPPASPAAAVDPSTPRGVTENAVAALLAATPVPPGARPATAGEARHITVASYSSSQNRVDRHATYVVAMSVDDVIAWYDAHQPPGTTTSGSGESSDHAVLTSRSLSFDNGARNPAYDGLEADVIAKPRGDERGPAPPRRAGRVAARPEAGADAGRGDVRRRRAEDGRGSGPPSHARRAAPYAGSPT